MWGACEGARGRRPEASRPVAAAAAMVLLAVVAATPMGRPAMAAPRAVVDVTSTPDLAEGEEFVAANPLNANQVLVGSNQYQPLTAQNTGNLPAGPSGTVTCGLWASHDRGATWSGGRFGEAGIGSVPVPSLPGLPGATLPTEFNDVGNLISADQNIVWDRRGNAYYQCIYSGVSIGDIKVLVVRSSDAGRTWSAPVAAFSEIGTQIQIDRSFLAIDTSGGPRDGTLYLAFETMFYQPLLSRVFVRSSVDQGRTWGPITRADSDAYQAQWDPRQFPQVGADGTLHIVYDSSVLTAPGPQQVGTPISLDLASSKDGGATFSHSVIAGNIQRGGSPDEAFNFFQEMIAAFAVDPSDARRMVAAWPESSSGVSRIAVRSSADGGSTWAEAATTAALGAPGQQDHPALTVLGDGRPALIWKDRSCCGGSFGSNFEVRLSLGSWNAGRLTLGSPQTLTDAPQPSTTGHHGMMPTEYISVAADATGVDASWDQMAGTLTDNVFRHLDVPGAAGAPAATGAVAGSGAVAATSSPSTGSGAAALRGGGVAAALALAGLAVCARRRRGMLNPGFIRRCHDG